MSAMPKVDGRTLKVAIVVSEYHFDITGKMLQAALEVFAGQGVPGKNVTVVHAPGAFEIPLACEKLARTKKYDALVALGCVIKGDTDHYYYIAGEVSRGIMDISLRHALPIGFGLLTTNNVAQAKARSSAKDNKGKEAALAVIKMI